MMMPDTAIAAKSPVKNVVFVLYNNVTLVDFTGATDVFHNTPSYSIHWLAPTMEPIATSENMQVLPSGTFDDAPEDIEILFVPGGNDKGVPATMFDERYRSFIRTNLKKATWAGSVCTGAFIMAAAGGFDDCEATTYWSQLGNLALLKDKLGIRVDLKSYPRYVLDHNKRRFSGGGVSSSIDLALELVKCTAGNNASKEAQLFIQYAPDPPNRSGDPSQASPQLTQAVMEIQTNYTGHIKSAVQRLIEE